MVRTLRPELEKKIKIFRHHPSGAPRQGNLGPSRLHLLLHISLFIFPSFLFSFFFLISENSGFSQGEIRDSAVSERKPNIESTQQLRLCYFNYNLLRILSEFTPKFLAKSRNPTPFLSPHLFASKPSSVQSKEIEKCRPTPSSCLRAIPTRNWLSWWPLGGFPFLPLHLASYVFVMGVFFLEERVRRCNDGANHRHRTNYDRSMTEC